MAERMRSMPFSGTSRGERVRIPTLPETNADDESAYENQGRENVRPIRNFNVSEEDVEKNPKDHTENYNSDIEGHEPSAGADSAGEYLGAREESGESKRTAER